MEHSKLFINGEFLDAAAGEIFESVAPGTGLPFATIAKAGKADAEAAVAAASKAFDSVVWSGLTPSGRMAKIQDFSIRLIPVFSHHAILSSCSTLKGEFNL